MTITTSSNQAMPKATKWRYCRHFKPLTIHCEFPPERSYTPPPLTQHRVFSRSSDPSSDAAERPTPAALLPIPLSMKIPKPRGEVSRISRGGYNLQEALGWPASEYEETRVRVLTAVVYCLFNFFPRRPLFHSWPVNT